MIQGGSKEAKTCSAFVSPNAFAAIPCCTRVGTFSMFCQCVSPSAILSTPTLLCPRTRILEGPQNMRPRWPSKIRTVGTTSSSYLATQPKRLKLLADVLVHVMPGKDADKFV